MTPFGPGVVEAMPIGFRALRTVREIDELRGKQDLFKGPSPQVPEALRQLSLTGHRVVQSNRRSNGSGGANSVAGGEEHRTREQVGAGDRGLRDVWSTIHASAVEIRFSPGGAFTGDSSRVVHLMPIEMKPTSWQVETER